jgi:hypothetical protein
MKRSILILGITLLSLTLVWACGKPEEPAKAQKSAAKPEAATAKPEPLAKEQGQKETVKLQIYDEPGMPIRAQYPGNMQVEGGCAGEGCGFTFTFKPQGNALDKAEVHIFLPAGAPTAAAQEPFVTGPNGLLQNNGWKQEGETADTGKFPHEWVRKIITFSDPGNQDMVVKILLGEASGQAVQIMLYYPGDMAKEFLANANLILENLQFKGDKLPLKRSQ